MISNFRKLSEYFLRMNMAPVPNRMNKPEIYKSPIHQASCVILSRYTSSLISRLNFVKKCPFIAGLRHGTPLDRIHSFSAGKPGSFLKM